ncbi:hypothetical protein MMC19_000369 [Ptychographa xylographoides]|nr:hypothetical protein [Ptychographa xylographoides]
MDLDINALGSKLNAVLDRPTEDRTSRSASPSLASTSSEALQYHQAVYRKPLTAEEQARRDEESEYWRTSTWGNEPTRRARQEQFEREHETLKLLGMRGWGMCEGYEGEVLTLTALRTAEDDTRNMLAEGYILTWTGTDQQALEFERQKEDYLQLADKLSIFLAGDVESESEVVLRYRLQNIKNLLQIYKSQWQECFGRLREDADKRKRLTQDPTIFEGHDHDTKTEGTFHNTLTDREQGDRSLGNKAPGLTASSKASQAAGNKQMGARRQANTFIDAAEPQALPANETSPKSRRTRPSIPTIAEDPTVTVSTNLSTRVLRQRPGRNILATRGSENPQGISKTQRPKTTRRKVRKD